MNEDINRRPARSKVALGIGMVTAGMLAGGVMASTLSASADTTPSTASSSQGTTSGQSGQSAPQAQPGQQGFDHGGANPVRSDEKAVTSDQAATLKAAAEAKVPGGTVYRVETDAGDAAFEVHLTNSSGAPVTVKFDKNLAFVAVEDGMGKGDPAPAGGQRGPAPQGQQGQQGGSSSSGSTASPSA